MYAARDIGKASSTLAAKRGISINGHRNA